MLLASDGDGMIDHRAPGDHMARTVHPVLEPVKVTEYKMAVVQPGLSMNKVVATSQLHDSSIALPMTTITVYHSLNSLLQLHRRQYY